MYSNRHSAPPAIQSVIAGVDSISATRLLPAAMLGLALLTTAGATAQPIFLFAFPFNQAQELSSWTVVSPSYSSAQHAAGVDVADDAFSGSMEIINSNSVVPFANAQFQTCIESAAVGQALRVGLAARMPPQSETGRISLVLGATSSSGCTGSLLEVLGSSALLTTQSNDVWTLLTADTPPAPAGTESVYLRVLLVKTAEPATATPLNAFIDDVLVERIDLFVDGFEGGNTLAWN